MHTEILSPTQRALLDGLKAVADLGEFYLAGGTALALRHGHRRSVDFDFFRPTRFDGDALLRRLSAAFQTLERLPGDADTVSVRLHGVETTFFHYPYQLLDALEGTPWGFGLAADSDIAAMKIEAVTGRGSRRDFIDLRVLCGAGLTLGAIFDLFDRKYTASRINRYHRLRALCYFTDAEEEPMPDMLIPFDWPEARQYFTTEAMRLLIDEAT